MLAMLFDHGMRTCARTTLALLTLLGVAAVGHGDDGAEAAANGGITPAAEERRMQVFLDDREVGLHTFRFDDSDGTLQVRSEAAFQVRVVFVTLFNYEHEANERWRGGCLVGLESKTDENGKRFEVASRSSDAGLEVTTRDGSHKVATDCPWSFAYWTPSLRERQLLVNPQDGAALEVDFEDLGPRTLKIGRSELEVRAWQLRGRDVTPGREDGAEVSITIFYDAEDRWAGLDSDVGSGRTLRYRPAPDDIVHPRA
ncbi:MAG: hypothetical protein JJT88_02915 [Gammaproteobacteria bacterium]|nr:hypothetical protein [Gammaproteobacteria bacterium]